MYDRFLVARGRERLVTCILFMDVYWWDTWHFARLELQSLKPIPKWSSPAKHTIRSIINEVQSLEILSRGLKFLYAKVKRKLDCSLYIRSVQCIGDFPSLLRRINKITESHKLNSFDRRSNVRKLTLFRFFFKCVNCELNVQITQKTHFKAVNPRTCINFLWFEARFPRRFLNILKLHESARKSAKSTSCCLRLWRETGL